MTASQQITKKQHILSKSILRNFLRTDGRLEAANLRTRVISHLGLNADPFVTLRSWDQRIETRTMNQIEREFGLVSRQILRKGSREFNASQHETISAMFSIWVIRQHRAANPIPDSQLTGILAPERFVSEDTLDQLEHRGIITFDSSGRIPGRMIAGPVMFLAIKRQIASMAGTCWGVLEAAKGEFALPDSFGDYKVLPLSPKHCLIAGYSSQVVDTVVIAELNEIAEANAREWLFARDFSACPGLSFSE